MIVSIRMARFLVACLYVLSFEPIVKEKKALPFPDPIAGIGKEGPTILSWQVSATFERQLRAGTVGFLKSVRRTIRQLKRFWTITVMRWSQWSGNAVAVAVAMLFIPIFDRRLWKVFRLGGVKVAGCTLSMAAAVYLRVLVDRRTPSIGKTLLAVGLVYGLAPLDLIPDSAGFLGLVDDAVIIFVIMKSFLYMCDERVVSDHAQRMMAKWRNNPKIQISTSSLFDPNTGATESIRRREHR